LLSMHGRMLIVGAMCALAALFAMTTPEWADAQGTAAATAASHCGHTQIVSAKRSLSSANRTLLQKKCAVAHRSLTTVSFLKSPKHNWMLAPRYKKCWQVPDKKWRRTVCRARALLRYHQHRLAEASAKIQRLTTPYWCRGLSGNRALGCLMAYAVWPSQYEWQELDTLWSNESGWDTHADNPTSDACGIPEAMNNCSYGYDPVVQIRWGINYILNRDGYGSPSRAMAHYRAHSWY